ncbi:PAS domain-containing hybrid sensor histidine kinase/response regulator [Hymenobacter ruricola]|uniref:histidine kinase n=1 Tax=Hymenobacter ruricola TaxID=2791023 RepID=A0ABS0I5F8_9BACT|nr:PAS domain-containing hybrid sensor histidine kinase/response regulator [Hymenobacter ruricola]MBF9222180.1 PAS domain S-box protein [Hymenobacter ruricola]
MTRAELEHALAQQQAENAALRRALAQAQPVAPVLPQQAHLLQLMQELYTAVLLTGTDGRVAWVNKGFTTLCGLETHDVLGKYPSSFLRPGLNDENVRQYIEDSLRAQVPFQYDVQNPRADAANCWIRVKVQPIHNERGEVVMAGLLEDITEWKNAQSTLAESEHRFQALAENVPGVLYEWHESASGTSRPLYASPKLYELFGISPSEAGRVMDFVHPDDLAALREATARSNRTKMPWFYEGRLVVPGQPVRWFRGSSVVTAADADGITYSGILQDITPLKQAQTALRESELRWRLAVEGFGDGTWELDLDNNTAFFSADYRAMLGYAEDEFPNHYSSWHSRVHAEDLEEALRSIATYLRGDSPVMTAEFRVLCKDGTYKWVLSRGLVTKRAPDGRPLILTGTHTDISELKQAKEALDTANRRLTTVIANFHEGVVLEDESRRIVLTNDAFCRLLDVPITPEQLVGKDGAWLAEGSRGSLHYPNQYVARITALLRRRQPVVGDVLSLRDGRILQRDFAPIFDQNRYIGHLWKYEDVTARTRAEEDLKRREEKYRGIIENMSLGLVEADLDDHLLYANQSFCDMTGFCTDELHGHKLSPLLLTGDDLELVESKLEARQRGVADSYEIAVTTKGGDVKWLLVSGAPLYDDDQQLVGSIGIYLDVTPQKRLEASLREAKALAEISTRAKQDFLANMSHEIRTPMNAILGMSQLLAKTELSAPQASYLHAITASAENLLVIINDILDLSKIEAGRMAVEKIGFSVCGMCAQVEKTLLYKAEEKGLSFVTTCDPAVPAVLLGDPYRITQVLLNLAGNSVKFTERGTVRLSCALLGTTPAGEAVVEFTVQDTGIGIEAEYLARVFDDFSQEDSSVTRKFGGTGLGLGISKKLVELLGGELHIESQKNHGTTSRFTLHLPVGTEHDVPQKEGADVSGLQHDLRGKRVLLVEDNVFNRMLASIFLVNAELTVTEAGNGQVAVDLLREHAYDLILMDVQMPVMNGYEATAIARQELGLTVPIIALTANAVEGERAKCLAAGMNDYLTKPFQEASLVKMVYDWVLGPLVPKNTP